MKTWTNIVEVPINASFIAPSLAGEKLDISSD